jgi:hypothetical protein
MESIAKPFLNLKRLDLSYYKVICECDQQIDNNYICIECHQKFDKFLSKMMIKVLHLNYIDISHPLIHSLKNFQRLQILRIKKFFKNMDELENYRLTKLTENSQSFYNKIIV